MKPEVQKKIEANVLERLNASVIALQFRNDENDFWRDLIDGYIEPESLPYGSGSDVNAALIQKAIIGMKSFLNPVLSRNPPMLVSSNDIDTSHEVEDDCRVMETFITTSFGASGYFKKQPELIEDAIALSYAIAMCSWQVKTSKEMVQASRGIVTGNLYEEEDHPNEELEPASAFLKETVESEGLEVAALDPNDFFYYPTNAKSVPDADACGHRAWMTNEQLYEMILEMGLDREKTIELMSKSRSSYGGDSDRPGIERKDDGNLPADENEIFQWFCKVPILFEHGKIITPENLIGLSLSCVLDRKTGVFLKMELSPYKHIKPYVRFTINPRAHRMEGCGIPEMLEDLYTIASAELRLSIDAASYRTSPAFQVKDSYRGKDLEKQKIEPGAIAFVKEIGDISPIQMAGSNEAMNLVSYSNNEAEQLYSAGGISGLNAKVRKNSEVQATQNMALSKMNFFKMNFQFGMEEMAQMQLAIYDIFASSEEKMLTDPETGESAKLTSAALKRDYTFHPYGDERSADPEKRIELGNVTWQTLEKYWAIILNPQSNLEMKRGFYRVATEALQNLNIRNPRRYLGDEPSENQQANQSPPQGQLPQGQPQLPQGQPQLPQGGFIPPQGGGEG